MSSCQNCKGDLLQFCRDNKPALLEDKDTEGLQAVEKTLLGFKQCSVLSLEDLAASTNKWMCIHLQHAWVHNVEVLFSMKI